MITTENWKNYLLLTLDHTYHIHLVQTGTKILELLRVHVGAFETTTNTNFIYMRHLNGVGLIVFVCS